MLVSQTVSQGITAFEAQDYLQALNLFEKAEREDRKNPNIILWLAKTHQALGHRTAAIEILQRLADNTQDRVLLEKVQSMLQSLISTNGQYQRLEGDSETMHQSSSAMSYLEDRNSEFPQNGQNTVKNGSDWQSLPAKAVGKPAKLMQRLSRLSLRTKGTLLAIAIGTLPVLSIGGIAYWQADREISQQINSSEASLAASMSSKVSRFMFERYVDIQVLANQPILRNSKLKAIISQTDKENVLTQFAQTQGVYDSIALIDLDGTVRLQSRGELLNQNHSDRPYFQEVLKTGLPVISEPTVSKYTGETVIFFAAPVRDIETQKLIGVIRSRMPLKHLDNVIKEFGEGQREYHMFDSSGKFFLAGEKEQVGRNALSDFQGLDRLVATNKPGNAVLTDQIDGIQQVVSYAPLEKFEGLPDLGWSTLLAIDSSTVYAPKQALVNALALGTGVAALLVAAIAAYLVNRATRPILAASATVQKLGRGELDARIAIAGEDELAVLGSNINQMADEIQSLLNQTQRQAQQRQAEQEKLQAQVDAIAQAVVAISTGKLDTRIPRLEGGDRLVQGLAENINQMTAQIQELVREQEQLAEDRKAQADSLTQQVLLLLTEVKGAAKGDLTVKAKVSEGEMGAVADSFNYLVNSLRRIVSNIKETAGQVIDTTSNSIAQTTDLAQQAQAQAAQVDQTLKQIEQVIASIQEVAQAAQQAEVVVNQATQTAQAGGEAVDRTVEGIDQLRSTIGEAAKMMKRLGEGSQQIGQIVTLISQIASKTDLLALNATIEAARAGEQGQGFAVVADEVRKLAERSAAATKEIAELVEGIQSETSQMIAAMDAGTEEVVRGTQLAANAKENLKEIVQVSSKIDKLVKDITRTTQNQTKVAAAIGSAVEQTRLESTQTAQRATEVTASLDELTNVVGQLQGSVQSFRTA